MNSAAKRMKAYRLREASGRMVLHVEIDAVPVTEFLIDNELLDVSHAEDRKAIGLSIEKLIELLMAARRLRDA